MTDRSSTADEPSMEDILASIRRIIDEEDLVEGQTVSSRFDATPVNSGEAEVFSFSSTEEAEAERQAAASGSVFPERDSERWSRAAGREEYGASSDQEYNVSAGHKLESTTEQNDMYGRAQNRLEEEQTAAQRRLDELLAEHDGQDSFDTKESQLAVERAIDHEAGYSAVAEADRSTAGLTENTDRGSAEGYKSQDDASNATREDDDDVLELTARIDDVSTAEMAGTFGGFGASGDEDEAHVPLHGERADDPVHKNDGLSSIFSSSAAEENGSVVSTNETVDDLSGEETTRSFGSWQNNDSDDADSGNSIAESNSSAGLSSFLTGGAAAGVAGAAALAGGVLGKSKDALADGKQAVSDMASGAADTVDDLADRGMTVVDDISIGATDAVTDLAGEGVDADNYDAGSGDDEVTASDFWRAAGEQSEAEREDLASLAQSEEQDESAAESPVSSFWDPANAQPKRTGSSVYDSAGNIVSGQASSFADADGSKNDDAQRDAAQSGQPVNDDADYWSSALNAENEEEQSARQDTSLAGGEDIGLEFTDRFHAEDVYGETPPSLGGDYGETFAANRAGSDDQERLGQVGGMVRDALDNDSEPPVNEHGSSYGSAEPNGLVSMTSEEISARALASLNSGSDSVSRQVYGALKISDSPNSESVELAVKNMMRPMIKDWLDQNLPHMVEGMVRAEIERISSRARHYTPSSDD